MLGEGWGFNLRRHWLPVTVLLIIGLLGCVDSLQKSKRTEAAADASPVEYNLRDREVRIELLIQDYHYLNGMRGRSHDRTARPAPGASRYP